MIVASVQCPVVREQWPATSVLTMNETEPVSELHFTPGNPRNVRVGLSYFF